MDRIVLVCLAILCFAAAGVTMMNPRPVGQLDHHLECAWDVDSRSYQTFIVYETKNGDFTGRSPASGACQP